MQVIRPPKASLDESYMFDRLDRLNRFLGRRAYQVEKIGERYRLIAVKVVSDGDPICGVVIAPPTTTTYISYIIDELWFMLHREPTV
ncbi:hypothetical protein EBR25_12865 [bacterium]|nr:hypothetical protein [bacterium]